METENDLSSLSSQTLHLIGVNEDEKVVVQNSVLVACNGESLQRVNVL